MAYRDKKYEKKYKHQWYLDNRQKQMDAKRKRRKEVAQWLKNYKRSLICADCGMYFNLYPECCDFHHLGKKKDNIAHIHTKKSLLKELQECIPLCANCHRIRHK